MSNICNLDNLYTLEFTFSTPRQMLEELFKGKGFGYEENYTEQDQENLCNDVNAIYQSIIEKNPLQERMAVITAGAPGAGKTSLLKQALIDKNIAYICPDDVCLKNQTRTYLAYLEEHKGEQTVQSDAYRHWRAGSNFASSVILANLILNKYSFYFGSTSTGDKTHLLFSFLKSQGFTIHLSHISAPDAVRVQSIKQRDQTFVQTTDEDIIEKGVLLPQRINDTYLKYANRIDFYYRGACNENAVLAAYWIRNTPETPEQIGTLTILNQECYDSIKSIHNTALSTLQKKISQEKKPVREDLQELFWEKAVEDRSTIVHA